MLNQVMPSPSINMQSFPQKQEKKKVSFAEAYPPPAALSSQHTGKPQQSSRVGEAAFSFTSKPLYTSAVFKLPRSSSSFQVALLPQSYALRSAAVPVRGSALFCTGVNLFCPVRPSYWNHTQFSTPSIHRCRNLNIKLVNFSMVTSA